MACLELRKESKWWYVRYQVDGKRKVKNLNVEVLGVRPESLKHTGSTQFENSRGRAEAKMMEFLAKLRNQASEQELAHEVYRVRTKRSIGTIKLGDLPDAWEHKIMRSRKPSERYAEQCRKTLERFVCFVNDSERNVEHLHQITHSTAIAFLQSEDQRHVSDKTWNDTLKLLKATFKHLRQVAGLAFNPFEEIPTRQVSHVYREPFSVEDLALIFEIAESPEHEFVRPIIITAACTAMRRGDCCMLRWSDVDLKEGFITVKTSKTGQTVDIPIFPMLAEEIRSRHRNGSEFVFPMQAEMYQSNPDGLTYRLRKVLADAGFRDGPLKPLERRDNKEVSDEEIREAGLAVIDSLTNPGKRDRVRLAFDLYMQGKPLCQVADEMGIGKGSVSNYLNLVESLTDLEFIRGKLRKRRDQVPRRGQVHRKRNDGIRSASVRDFHSFRTTWITLALSSDIPLDLVKKVTGHRTVDVVMKHYFRPNRGQLRQALQEKMPALLTAGTAVRTGNEQAAELLRNANAANWREVVEEALRLLA